jgi:Zn finger protein HypA/HybF involved in hydrogenase expression
VESESGDSTGVQFVAEVSLTSLRQALEQIRDQAIAALRQLESSDQDLRRLSWQCTGCGHRKHFTRPVSVEIATPCPKCGGSNFAPIK